MDGRTIAGRYELTERIGGSSWRALDNELGREVLVRLPAGEIGGVTLAHPNIVRVFDQGEEEGEPYAVLEYLAGGSLEQRLQAGSLTDAEARGVAADLEAALAYAHAQGVTHGSLGAGSVLFDTEGRAKVTGFGGDGSPEDDLLALAALLQTLAVDAVAGSETDVTQVLPVPPPVAVSRRPVALAAAAVVALLAAGIGAAYLATSGDSPPDGTTPSLSLQTPTGSTAATTQEPADSQPATTAETTTEETTPTTDEGVDDRATADHRAPSPTARLRPRASRHRRHRRRRSRLRPRPSHRHRRRRNRLRRRLQDEKCDGRVICDV